MFACLLPVLIFGLLHSAELHANPSPAEQAKLDQLNNEIDGAVVYSKGGRIFLVVIGEWNPIDLGAGLYARWSPHGDRIAVLEATGKVLVMDADGGNRIQLATGAATDNCPLEFHTNGQEVIWLSAGVWKATDIDSHDTRDLMSNPPHAYSGEAGISADGQRLACRASHDLYAIDLSGPSDRKYADGCSAGVSPNGQRVMNNVDGHASLQIRDWDGAKVFSVHAANGCDPDGSWDNHHWSNHDDYIAAKGDGSTKEAYLIKVSADLTTRVTWVGGVDYPDLYLGAVVAPDPIIDLDPASLSFAAIEAGSTPAAQMVSVANAGGGTLADVAVSDDAAWLTVLRSGSGNAQILTNDVDIGGLAVDSFSATVTVSGGGAVSAASYQVNLQITAGAEPILSLQPTELLFLAQAGGSDPAALVVAVLNAGTGTLADATSTIDFGGGPSGWLQVSRSGTDNDQLLANQVSLGALVAGTYQAEVSVNCPNAANTPTSYAVQLQVEARPSITVTSPGAGTEWQAGTAARVTWTTEAVNDCAIKLSLDGGKTFPVVLSVGVDHSSADWLNWPITVPNLASEQCVVLVEDYNRPYPAVYGLSSVFSIIGGQDASVTLLSPVGAETLIGNTVHHILWTSEEIDTVVLDLSLDGGLNWEPAIATVNAGDTDWGDFAWDVPNVSTYLAVVRVASPGGGAADQSGLFQIEPELGLAGELNLTRVRIRGQVPEQAAGMEEVTVAGVLVTVGPKGEFEVELDVPLGVERLNFEITGKQGDMEFTRVVQVDVEDAVPPIDGLGVSAEELTTFLGGRKGVLTWVDGGGRIRVLDFRVDQPQVELLSDEIDCINPLVSPDGSRVVYSQGAPSGSKMIKLRYLAGGDAQLVATGDLGYFRFVNGEQSVVWCDWSEKSTNGSDGRTWLQPIETGGIQVLGEASELHDRAMDAGSNGSGRWLGQVYLNLWAHDLSTGTDYPMSEFYLLDDSVADHQTCNGSMAPDDSGRIMCLVIPHDFVRVFAYQADRDRFEVSSEFDLPAGLLEWEFPEWSTDPGYLTAVLRASDLKNRLFIVKMAEGKLVPEVLEITGESGGASYSHLYLEPR